MTSGWVLLREVSVNFNFTLVSGKVFVIGEGCFGILFMPDRGLWRFVLYQGTIKEVERG